MIEDNNGIILNKKINYRFKLPAVFLLGFSSGIPIAMLGTTLTAWLNSYNVDKTTIGLFTLLTIPYIFKFLWAPFIENTKIPLLSRIGHKRSWLLLTQLSLVATMTTLGQLSPVHQLNYIAAFSVLISFISATQMIIIDSYRVQLMEIEEQGSGSAAAITGYRIGLLVAGGGSMLLVDYITDLYNYETAWHATYFIMALLTPLGFAGTLITKDHSQKPTIRYKSVGDLIEQTLIQPLTQFTKNKGWISAIAVVSLFKLGDTLVIQMFVPFLQDMGYTLTEIGLAAKSFGSFAAIVGGIIGGLLIVKYGTINILWLSVILQCITNGLYFVILKANHSFILLATIIIIENAVGAIGTSAYTSFMAILCCRSKHMSTQHAMLTSFAVIGIAIPAMGGWIVTHMGWYYFFCAGVIAHAPAIIATYITRNRYSIYYNDTILP